MSYLEFDVTTDEFPRAEFDLVHSRFLLQHLAEREDVLDRMIS
ncbi:methyltransferase domain-containing protein [Lentzea flava]